MFAIEWDWVSGVFDPILRLVADDEIEDVMIVATDCMWLFHPYAGGMT